MFITDRDLLALEPDLFRDVGFLAQRLINATGSITSGKLNITGGDFAAAGVTVGHVVVHGSQPLEITLRNSATQVNVSLLRVRTDDPPINPPNAGAAAAVVFTFAPQIAAAHAGLLMMLGLPEAGTGAFGEVDETAITNPGELRMLETLLALRTIWAAAAAVGGAGSSAAARAEQYRLRAAHERSCVRARLDLDGDGVPDAERRAGAGVFVRR
jgi:hypothetical protein